MAGIENDPFNDTEAKIASRQRIIARMETNEKYHFCQFEWCMRRVPVREPFCAEHQEQYRRTRQPFADADVLFRFVPTEKERISSNSYEEYAVIADATVSCGFVIYAKWEEEWSTHPRQSSNIITHLLAEHATLTTAFATACETIQELGRDLGEKEHWQNILADLAIHCKDKADRSDIAHGQVAGKLRQRVKNLEQALADATPAFVRVAAERDCYRNALDTYANVEYWRPHAAFMSNPYIVWNASADDEDIGKHGYDLARTTLEQGEKLRELRNIEVPGEEKNG